jgi:hypothetical protein
MATSYESLLPEIIPMVPGCPDTLIENNIRAAVIEFCEKSEAYQQELDPVTTVANIYEYDLEPPPQTSVCKILWATHLGEEIEAITTALLEQREPKWRDSNYAGRPKYFVKQNPSTFWLVPVPNLTQVSSTIIRAVLKPTYTSTACDDGVMSDYREAIINGALFRLLRMPSKDWTDYAGAQVYGSLFNEGLVYAERKARQGDVRVSRKVAYGGVHKPYKFTRNRYSRR